MAYEKYTPTSTAIARLDYDDDENMLFLTFTDGKQYIIENFPAIEYARWKSAESAGLYFNQNVRGKY